MAVNVGSVTVSLDRAHLKARMERGSEAAGAALAEQVLSNCNQYAVPDDGEHTLKDSGRVEKIDGDWAVTWNTVYAAYQFYGCWPDGSHKILDGPPVYNSEGKKIRGHTQGYTDKPSTHWTETTRARYAEDWRAVAQKEHTKGAE